MTQSPPTSTASNSAATMQTPKSTIPTAVSSWVPEAWVDAVVDSGMVPDFLMRRGIRRMLTERVAELNRIGGWDAQTAAEMAYVQMAEQREATVATDKANEQHYEVPTAFIKLCLGKRMKYSACLYPQGVASLDQAEQLMFDDYCQKANLRNGQKVLDLGCGWGSLTLYLAEKYPQSRIYALSNSDTQKAYIEGEAKARSLSNVKVYVGDVAKFSFPTPSVDFPTGARFDRILSIEMLEHVRNHARVFHKMAGWLSSDEEARCFVQVFCHRSRSYDFDTEESGSWMARHFFTGGCMPSESLFTNYQRDLRVVRRWALSGTHYSRTSEDWLKRLDSNLAAAIETLKLDIAQKAQGSRTEEHSPGECKRLEEEAGAKARALVYRWRVFFLAVAECFGYNDGEEWGVAHYLFARQDK